MTVNLPISRLVNFGAVITPQLVQAPALNTGLVLGTSTVIDVQTRMRSYATLAAIAADFGTLAEEYLAAVPWFAQSPQPTSMNIGRWAKTNAAGQLFGAALSAANTLMSAWTAVTTGSFKLSVDGGAVTNVPALDFHLQTNLNGVASVIQTGIQGLGGAFAAVTCKYDAVYNRFYITSGTTGAGATISFLTVGSTGVDISGMMGGLAASAGAYVAAGMVAETALAAVALFDNQFGGQWYHLVIPSSVDADALAIAPYLDGGNNPHFLWYTSSSAAMLAAGDTTNIAYSLKQLLSQHAAVQYSSTSAYAAWSMAARIASVNWNGSNTAISLMYKQEPGIVAETLTATQAAALDGYNANVYVNYASGTPIIEQGICPSGQFIDTVVGIDGLRTQIMTNIFNILLGSATKVPQTDAGANTIQAGVENACSQYVINGYGAPGVWNASGFGALVPGQYLDRGYYIYAQPMSAQSQAQRQVRICPPIQVAFKLAGAIDTVTGTIYVNQ